MQMAERPHSVREWQRWLSAVSQEDYARPGSFSVLSIIVRRDLPARIALHLRPAAIEGPPSRRNNDDDADASAWAGPEAVGAWR
jgi:hypothetical protein